MPIDPNIIGNFKSFNDYQRLNDEFEQRKALQQAQIQAANIQAQKAMIPDYDEIGKAAFIQAATQGADSLTPVQKAALLQADSKQQTFGFNPATGRMEQKPSMLDRAGIQLGSIQQTAQNASAQAPAAIITPNAGGSISQQVVNGGQNAATIFAGDAPPPASSPPAPPSVPLFGAPSPKSEQKLAEANIESGRKRVDELVAAAASSGAAKQAANTMAALLPDMGYTGTGATVTSGLDKALTGFGYPNVIAGKPSARETFQSQGVDAWVKAVEPLKGALTEQEGARFDKAISNLSTTPEGIKARAKLTEALANRAQEKSIFYEQYFSQNGSLTGADKIWADWSDKNPAITDELLGVTPSSSAPVVLKPMAGKEAMETEFQAKKVATPEEIAAYKKMRGIP